MFDQLLLDTKIKSTIHKKELKVDLNDLETKEKPKPPIVKNLQENSRDYLQEFKDIMINRLANRWLNTKNEKKEYFSATEIIECPKQTWYKLKGKITKDMLDYDKFFYLLDIYARMGDTVHNYIYKTLEFEDTETRIVDKENRVSGKYDIYDKGTLIDIKSSMNPYDVKPQLSVYYYLVNHYKKLPVNKVYVWWVLKDKLEEYNIQDLEELFPKYLNRAKMLYTALQENDYPESLGIDDKSCKYCPIESWCKGQKPKQKILGDSKERTKMTTSEKKDDIIFLL